MGLKDLYYKLEDAYYGFLDKLDKAGIPVYSLIDPIEAQNIPSFPIVLGLLLVVLGVAGWFLLGAVAPGESTLSLSVVDEEGNPLGNAIVTVKVAGKDSFVVNTSETGLVEVRVPVNQAVELTAKKDEFETVQELFTAKEPRASHAITLKSAAKEILKTVKFLKAGTNELVTGEITVRFSCGGNSSFNQTKTTSNGRLDLSVPKDCGILYASPLNGFKTENDSIDLSTAETAEVFLDAPTQDAGALTVSVLSSDGQALAGITVYLKAFGSTSQIAEATTTSAGTVVFNDVVPGKYYVTTYDPTGAFAEFDSSVAGDVKEVLPKQSAGLSVRLAKKAVGKIRLVLRDSQSQEPVANALVTLSKGDKSIASQLTAANGSAEFSVGENVAYEILVDHAEYLLFKKSGIMPGEQAVDLRLEKATAQNAGSLTVTVADESNNPVEDARLRLKKADGTAIGSEIVTGANGEAVFSRVEDGTYYVYAYKPGFGEATSLPVQMSRRQVNRASIVLPIGMGAVEVRVTNEEGAIVAGASVRALSVSKNESLAEQMADSDGVARVEVRADKTVYFVVNAQDYLPYTTIPVQPVKDVTQTIAVMLGKTVSKTEIELMGLYSGADAVKNALNPGQKYTARLRLKLPPGSSFEEAGIHLRTGENDLFESDGLYLSNVRAATSQITRGQSFTPYDGYSIDSTRLTTGNGKWANIVFPNAMGGIYEAEADVMVRDTVPLGTVLPLHYRGWAKTGGGFIRFPADNILGSKVSVAGRYDLYANTKTRSFSAGPSTLCDDAFCYTFGLEDLGTGIQTAVLEDYPARIQSSYKLSFTVTSISDRQFNSTELHVENAASAVSFSEYSVTDVSGMEKKGTLDGSQLVVPVGNMGRDDDVFGSVKLRTKREGVTDVVVSLVSQGQRVFERRIRLNVLAAAEMELEVLPKIIVPFINNNLLIKVTEKGTDNTISDATVTIRRNDVTLVSGKTNSEGIFVYQLTPTGAGSKITVLVEKPGYRSTERVITVSENILTVRPGQIKDLLVIGSNPEKEHSLFLGNQTEIPLVVEEVRESTAFKEFFKFTFADSYAGTELPTNSDQNLQFVIGLTPAAARILEPKKVSGSLDVVVSNREFNRQWTASIPVELRIGFGDEVDEAGCFSVFPQDLEISTNAGVKTYELTLKNNCAVNGQAIPLTNVEVKVVEANKNPLGEFFLSVDASEGGANRVRLTNQPAKALNVLAENAEVPLTLEFKPAEVSSGESKPTLVFTAAHNTASGQERLTQNVRALVRINDLVQCVEFIGADKLVVSSNPFNLGYGQYNANTTYDPFNYAIPDAYRNSYGYSTGVTQPFSGYQNPQSNVPVSSSQYVVNEQGVPIDPGTRQPYPQNYPDQVNNPNYGYYNQPYNQATYNSQYSSYPANLRAYPYSDYRAPNYNYDVYGGQATGQTKGNSSNFGVKNNCASAVVIDFNPEAGLLVSPQRSVVLEPNSEQTVSVQSSYVLGNYSVEARGKLKNSKEPSVPLRTITVTVDNEFSRSYSDCIDIDPAGTISLQNFVGKPKKLEVINKCYAEGIRVEPVPSSISFSNRDMILSWSVKGERLETKSTGKVTQIVSFDLIPNTQQYQNNAPPFPFEGSPMAKLGNLSYFATAGYYRVNAPTDLVVFFSNRLGSRSSRVFHVTIQDLLALGEFAERWMSYGDPNATPQSCLNPDAFKLSNHTFKGTENDCIPADLLEKNGGVYVYDTAKDMPMPFFRFAKQTPGGEVGGCGRMDRITGIQVKDNRIEKNGVVVSFEINRYSLEENLRSLGQTIFTLGGLLGGEMPKGGHDIIMRVDASEDNEAGGWNGRATKFSETVTVTVERAINGKRGNVILPLNFCINQGEPRKVQVKATDQFACENGKSGQGVVTDYGFDKLLFDWRWGGEKKEGVNPFTCGQYEYEAGADGKLGKAKPDETNYKFCDAVQFGESVAQKASLVSEAMKNLPKENALGERISSLYLYKHLIKAVTLKGVDKDSKSPMQNRLYFVGRDGTQDNVLLRGESLGVLTTRMEQLALQFLQAAKAPIESLRDPAKAKNLVDRTREIMANRLLLDEFQNIQRDMVIQIPFAPTKAIGLKITPAEYQAVLKQLGAHSFEETGYSFTGSYNGVDVEGGFYLLTLEEYQRFQQTVASLPNPESFVFDTFKSRPAAEQKALTLKALNLLKDSMEFRVGIRDKLGLTEEEKLKLMRDGSLDRVAEVSAYKDRYKFASEGIYKLYKDNIEFNAYLKEDGLSSDFKDDFQEAFKDKLGKTAGGTKGELKPFKEWLFCDDSEECEKNPKQITKFDSGLYRVRLQVYRDGMVIVRMKFEKPLKAIRERFASNPLFGLPLDNLVGLKGAELLREGYGTTYKVDSGEQDKMFFSYADSESARVAKAIGGDKPGYRHVLFDYVNRYDDTKTGKILSLVLPTGKVNDQYVPGALIYQPSDPVPLQLEVEKTSKDLFTPAGLIYQFNVKGATPGNEFIKWEASANTITGKTGKFLETVEAVGRLCKGKGSDKYHAVMFDDQPKNGRAVLKAVTFVPTRSGEVTASELQVYCGKDKFKLTAWDEGQAKSIEGEQAITLNQRGERLNSDYTFENLVKLLGQGRVCVEMKEDQTVKVGSEVKGPGMNLYWNQAELLKQTEQGTAAQPKPPQPAQVQEVTATLTDNAIALSPSTVNAGTVRFNITNNGNNKHTFAIGGSEVILEKGASQSMSVTLPAGQHEASCSIHGGMKATLTAN
ncbi:MAG: carboxypeptidase regulatory-like domain-containing protein [Candidatus Diapherotrites archaeon]|uniref:Carboxypeptidase regulatory-like domain-containing protein n=1 Tax=Candidatus Iainarchaeum sp. TaxID=3101447 RepID=A0A8T4L9D5_9ARCH|nr:carboxypeptidase regulatory-like domain-containing protein [Candidatus Diapherotrites archaeon]